MNGNEPIKLSNIDVNMKYLIDKLESHPTIFNDDIVGLAQCIKDMDSLVVTFFMNFVNADETVLDYFDGYTEEEKTKLVKAIDTMGNIDVRLAIRDSLYKSYDATVARQQFSHYELQKYLGNVNAQPSVETYSGLVVESNSYNNGKEPSKYVEYNDIIVDGSGKKVGVKSTFYFNEEITATYYAESLMDTDNTPNSYHTSLKDFYNDFFGAESSDDYVDKVIDNNDGTAIYKDVYFFYTERNDGTRNYVLDDVKTDLYNLSYDEQKNVSKIVSELQNIEKDKRTKKENSPKPSDFRYSDFPKHSKRGEFGTMENYVSAIKKRIDNGEIFNEKSLQDFERYSNVISKQTNINIDKFNERRNNKNFIEVSESGILVVDATWTVGEDADSKVNMITNEDTLEVVGKRIFGYKGFKGDLYFDNNGNRSETLDGLEYILYGENTIDSQPEIEKFGEFYVSPVVFKNDNSDPNNYTSYQEVARSVDGHSSVVGYKHTKYYNGQIDLVKFYSEKMPSTTPLELIVMADTLEEFADKILNPKPFKSPTYIDDVMSEEYSTSKKLVVDKVWTYAPDQNKIQSITNVETLEVVGKKKSFKDGHSLPLYYEYEDAPTFESLDEFERHLYTEIGNDYQHSVEIDGLIYETSASGKLIVNPVFTKDLGDNEIHDIIYHQDGVVVGTRIDYNMRNKPKGYFFDEVKKFNTIDEFETAFFTDTKLGLQLQSRDLEHDENLETSPKGLYVVYGARDGKGMDGEDVAVIVDVATTTEVGTKHTYQDGSALYYITGNNAPADTFASFEIEMLNNKKLIDPDGMEISKSGDLAVEPLGDVSFADGDVYERSIKDMTSGMIFTGDLYVGTCFISDYGDRRYEDKAGHSFTSIDDLEAHLKSGIDNGSQPNVERVLYFENDNNTYVPTSEKIIVEDYPYGYKLRTTLTHTLDFDFKKGYRVSTQTVDPKSGRINKPKKSTYADFMVRYFDENKHVKTKQISLNGGAESINKLAEFVNKHFGIFTPEEIETLYLKMLASSKIDMKASVMYGGSSFEKLKPYYQSSIDALIEGINSKGMKNVFASVYFDTKGIDSTKDKDFRPFGN